MHKSKSSPTRAARRFYSVSRKRRPLKKTDKKFRGTKRFGLDGGESTIPALEQIIKQSSIEGVEEVVIGMAHRGRLNVLIVYE